MPALDGIIEVTECIVHVKLYLFGYNVAFKGKWTVHGAKP